jgi:hypothetical protein
MYSIISKNILLSQEKNLVFHDLAHLYKDYQESQAEGSQLLGQAYRNALLLERTEGKLERDHYLFAVGGADGRRRWRT